MSKFKKHSKKRKSQGNNWVKPGLLDWMVRRMERNEVPPNKRNEELYSPNSQLRQVYEDHRELLPRIKEGQQETRNNNFTKYQNKPSNLNEEEKLDNLKEIVKSILPKFDTLIYQAREEAGINEGFVCGKEKSRIDENLQIGDVVLASYIEMNKYSEEYKIPHQKINLKINTNKKPEQGTFIITQYDQEELSGLAEPFPSESYIELRKKINYKAWDFLAKVSTLYNEIKQLKISNMNSHEAKELLESKHKSLINKKYEAKRLVRRIGNENYRNMELEKETKSVFSTIELITERTNNMILKLSSDLENRPRYRRSSGNESISFSSGFI